MQDGTSRKRSRRHTDARCIYPECRYRPIAKYDLPFCGLHTQIMENAFLARRGEVADRCFFPGCREYVSDTPETRLCNAHLAIVVRHGLRNPAVCELLPSMTAEWEEPAPEPADKQPVQGTIYYVEVDRYIKVGWTSDMDRRMRHYPPTSRLLATEPGTRSEETRRHKMLAVHRTHGREWYAPTASVMHHIEMVKAKHGEPDPAAFAAQPVTLNGKLRRAHGTAPSGRVRGSVSRPLRG